MIVPIVAALALVFLSDCALPAYIPADDRPDPDKDGDNSDQNVGQDGKVVRDGGVDASEEGDLRGTDAKSDASGDRVLVDRTDGSSQYDPPTQQRPIHQSTLPPTQGFFKWMSHVPSGRSLASENICLTSGDPATIGANCFSVSTSNSCYTADTLERGANYSWQVQSCYDGGECSQYSGVKTFSTDESLQARWRFDEGSGTVANDSSGVSAPNNGQLRGVPLPQWQQGVRSSALQFDGNGSHVFVGDKFGGLSQFTLGAWVLTTSPRAQSVIVSRSSPTQNSFVLSLSDDGSGKVKFSTFTSREVIINSTKSVSDGQWHFVMATYDGTTMKIYIDGVEDANAAQSGSLSTLPADVCIGDKCVSGDPSQLGVQGFIDEVSLFDRALNSEQVVNEYCVPYCSPNSNLRDPLPQVCGS